MSYRFNLGSVANCFIFSRNPSDGDTVLVEMPMQDLNGKLTAGLINNNQRVDFLVDDYPSLVARGTIDLATPIIETPKTWLYRINFDAVLPELFTSKSITLVCDIGSAFGAGIQGNTLVGLNDTDVNDTNPLNDNDVLFYDATLGKWTHGPPSAGSDPHAIISTEHTDTELTGTLTNNDVLTYDSGLSKWTNKPMLPTVVDTSAGHNTIHRTSNPTADGEWYYSGSAFFIRDTLVGGVPVFGVELFNANTVVAFYSKTTEKFWYLKFGKIVTVQGSGGVHNYTNVSNGGVANPFVDGEETYMIVMKSHITDINLIPNVDINTPTDGQVLTYSFATSKWINQTLPAVGVINDALNVGEGTGIFKEKVSDTLHFKTLTSNDSSVAIAPSGTDYVDFSVNFPAGVETLGALTNVADIVDTLSASEAFHVLTWDNKSSSWKNLPTISSFGESGTGESIWSGQIIEGSIQLKKFESSDLSVNVTSTSSTVNLRTDVNRLSDTDISNAGLPLENHKHLKWDVLSSSWVDNYITVPDNSADGLQNGIWIDTVSQKLKFKPSTASEFIVSYVSPVNPYDALTTNYGARNRFKSNDIQQSANIVTGWLDSGVTGGGSFTGGASTIYNPTALDGKPSVETVASAGYPYVLDLGANINTAYTMAFVIQDMTTTTGTYIEFLNDTAENGYIPTTNIMQLYVGGNNFQYYFAGQLGDSNYLSPPGGPPNAGTTSLPLLMIFRNANIPSGSFKANFERDVTLNTHASTQNGTINARYIRIGSSAGGDYTACKMSEVVFWDRFLSDTEVTEISDVLMGYYGQRTLQPTVATDANLFVEQLADVTITAPVLPGSTLINDGVNWVNSKYDYSNLLNVPAIVPDTTGGHKSQYVTSTDPLVQGDFKIIGVGPNSTVQIYKELFGSITTQYILDQRVIINAYLDNPTSERFCIIQCSITSAPTLVGNYYEVTDATVRFNNLVDGDNCRMFIQYPNVDNLNDMGGVLEVAKGGTGQIELTSNNFLVGNGTSGVDTTKVVPTGDVVGTTDNQTLTTKTINAVDNSIISTGAIVADYLRFNGSKFVHSSPLLCSIYMSGNTTSTPVNQLSPTLLQADVNNYIKVLGTTSLLYATVGKFDVATSGRIQYTGAETTTFSVVVTYSANGGNDRVYAFRVAKGPAPLGFGPIVSTSTLHSSRDAGNSHHTTITLDQNQWVEFYAGNLNTADPLTVKNMYFEIRGI